MKLKRYFYLIFFFIFLIFIPSIYSIYLEGDIYNLDLKKITSVIEINTTPIQRIVAKEHYSFNLTPGIYSLYAYTLQNNIKTSEYNETINLINKGKYNLDIILFPSLDSDEQFNEDLTLFDDNEEKNYFNKNVFFILFTLIILLIAYYINQKLKNKSKELKDDAKKILDFIISNNGRTTQTEIRKNFPSSEAKISLILTELEHKKYITKIKKGRTNIIILKK